jgi:hypothetical protein
VRKRDVAKRSDKVSNGGMSNSHEDKVRSLNAHAMMSAARALTEGNVARSRNEIKILKRRFSNFWPWVSQTRRQFCNGAKKHHQL